MQVSSYSVFPVIGWIVELYSHVVLGDFDYIFLGWLSCVRPYYGNLRFVLIETDLQNSVKIVSTWLMASDQLHASLFGANDPYMLFISMRVAMPIL